MELIFLKNSKMFRFHDKCILKLCFLSLFILMISECSWANGISKKLSKHEKDILADVPPPITSDTTTKPTCIRKFADGTPQMSTDCEESPMKEQLTSAKPSNSSKENSTDAGITISSSNSTSINIAKPIHNNHTSSGVSTNSRDKNHSTKNTSHSNETVPTNSSKEIKTTTDNAEVASMNSHTNKYTGGLDVDEKYNTTNDKNNNMDSTSNSSQNNNKFPTNKIDHKGSKSGENNTVKLQTKESISKQLFSTKATGIAAGICVTVASLAYVSLMVWKKISYKHYANREMLLSEDDLGDIHDEDMRHFEAACIQIET